jgi:undecaprenyl-diphosphatase
MLPITGFLLLMLPKIKPGEVAYRDIGMGTAFLIGIAQAFALLPGISRSGTTIVAGCFLGLQRQSAATFSFLLAVPAISGACLLEAKDIYDQGGLQCSVQWATIGAVVSFAVGLLALRLLVTMLSRGSLHWFAYWLIPFGLANVVWQLHLMVQALVE